MNPMDQLLRLLAQCLNTSESDLSIDTRSDDLDTWDSLAVINLAISLEGEYGVALTAEEVEQLKSVRAIVEILGRHQIVIGG
jgi:acyl carrier protein